MASLALTIGQLSGVVTADNAKASAILSRYADAIGAQGTNQEKINAVVQSLVRHMQQEGHRAYSNNTMVAAAAAIQAEIDSLTWE